jgi:hypothetical protein
MWHEDLADPPLLSDWLVDRERTAYAGARLVLLVAGPDGKPHWIAARGERWVLDGAMTGGRWAYVTDAARLAKWWLLSVLSVEQR